MRILLGWGLIVVGTIGVILAAVMVWNAALYADVTGTGTRLPWQDWASGLGGLLAIIAGIWVLHIPVGPRRQP